MFYNFNHVNEFLLRFRESLCWYAQLKPELGDVTKGTNASQIPIKQPFTIKNKLLNCILSSIKFERSSFPVLTVLLRFPGWWWDPEPGVGTTLRVRDPPCLRSPP